MTSKDFNDLKTRDYIFKIGDREKGIQARYDENTDALIFPRAVFDYVYELLKEALSQEPCDDAVIRDFQIGDEVRIIGSDPIYDDCDVGWVIRNASEKVKTMYVMRNDGSAEEEAKAEWYRTGRYNAMLAEAIKALPSVTLKPIECDDAISRDAVIGKVKELFSMGECYCDEHSIIGMINELPSVTQKSGKWIDYRDDGFVECPFCGHATNCEDDIDELHYCFYCGAKMVEPQESEVRNEQTSR